MMQREEATCCEHVASSENLILFKREKQISGILEITNKLNKNQEKKFFTRLKKIWFL